MNIDLPPVQTTGAAERLADLLAEFKLPALDPSVLRAFESYLTLYIRWNGRINLSAIRDQDGILKRHFVESIACAYALPANIATLLDFGSGAGFPGIPIALCRPSLAVTLAESNSKKAAFLQEAVRVLGLTAKVHRARAESLTSQFDCVTLRAVDRMHAAVKAAGRLVLPVGCLAVMTTEGEFADVQLAAGPEFRWTSRHPLPGSDRQVQDSPSENSQIPDGLTKDWPSINGPSSDGRILAVGTRV